MTIILFYLSYGYYTLLKQSDAYRFFGFQNLEKRHVLLITM